MASSLEQLQADLKRIGKELVTKKIVDSVSRQMRDLIYKRTKSGKGLSVANAAPGIAKIVRLKPLTSAEYKRYRARRILGPFGSPTRSNLTFSGELLESLIVTSLGVELEDVKHSGSDSTMRQIAKYQEDDGRAFFGISDTEDKILDALFKRLVRQRIRTLIR